MKEKDIGFLLIHGFTGMHFEMKPLEEFLLSKSINVRNITLPGHETTPQDLAKTTWQMWVEYAQEELEILKQESEKVFVAGLSMGGIITLILGSRNKDLNGIISMATPYKSPDWRMGLLRFIPLIEKIYPMHKYKEEGWEDLKALSNHRSYGYYPTASIKELSCLLKAVKKNIPKITIPILIMQAKKDSSIPHSHPRWIYDNVKSKDKKIIWIEKGGHVIPEDAGKEEAFSAISEWIKDRK